MSSALVFMANWRKWQRVLRHNKGFSLIHSVRFGMWLARGSEAHVQRVTGEIHRTAEA